METRDFKEDIVLLHGCRNTRLFSGVRVVRSLVLCLVFSTSLFVCFFLLFFCPLYCLRSKNCLLFRLLAIVLSLEQELLTLPSFGHCIVSGARIAYSSAFWPLYCLWSKNSLLLLKDLGPHPFYWGSCSSIFRFLCNVL
jgi:hypothetical protein